MPKLFVYSRKGKFSQFSLKREKIIIGRSAENDVVVKDPYSSNQHAFIYPSGSKYVLRDNNSKNGTFLNSVRVKGEIELKKGDEILIGSTRILFNKELPTNVEVTPGDSDITNIQAILPLKEVQEKPDISTTIRAKVKESDLEELGKEYRLLSAIKAVSHELLLYRPEPELIDKIMEIINGILPMDRGTIMMMDGHPPHLQPRSTCINHTRLMGKRFQVSQNILNMVMDKHSSLLISDVKDDTRLRKIHSVVIQKIHSAVCVPLWIRQEIIGIFYSDRIYLPQAFSEEDLELLTLVANMAAVKIKDAREEEERRKQEEIRKQLELAAQIQKDFLPWESPKFEGFDIDGINVPTYMVGGDYYDYMDLGPNRLGVAIADVSGKGPPAALHMVCFRTRLEVEAVPGHDIQEMTATLSDFVHGKTDANRYISFFFCELDNMTGELRYVNAGHHPPIVIRRRTGKTERLKTCGLCLGMFPSEKYEMHSVSLERGDIAVLYTDGITECRNKDNKEFGERRFVTLIKRNSKSSTKDLLERVFKELDQFTGGAEQMDDMTLVIIKRTA